MILCNNSQELRSINQRKCAFMGPQTIPLGCKFKFDPEDHELLVYLKCKSMEEPLPCEGFIEEIDLYRVPDPGSLFERTPEKVVYIFTKLKKVSKNGKRIDRTVSGNRTWKGVDGGKPIYDAERHHVVGEKKNFVLVNKMKVKLGYNMTEFSLDNEALKNSRFKDYVVCKIKKKIKKLRSIGNFPEVEGDAMMGSVSEEGYPSSVSTPAIEGEVIMTPISEEKYQHYDLGISVVQRQSQQEEAQQCYQVSELHQGMDNNVMPMFSGGDELHQGMDNNFMPTFSGGDELHHGMNDNLMPMFSGGDELHQGMNENFMPMFSGGDFGSDMELLNSEYFGPNTFQEVNSWAIDGALTVLESLDMIDELAAAPPLPLPALVDDYSATATAPAPAPALPPHLHVT